MLTRRSRTVSDCTPDVRHRGSLRAGLAVGLIITLIVGLLTGVIYWKRLSSSPDAVLRSARKQIYTGKVRDALKELQPWLEREPADGGVCFLAGEAYSELRDFRAALTYFLRVPDDHSKRAEACFRAGDIFLIQLYEPTQAELFLKEALKRNPEHQSAQAHLAALYGLCGLTSLTSSIRMDRIQQGQFTEVDLVLLALGDTAAENADAVRDYVQHSPEDALTRLAQAHQLWQQNEFSAAKALYELALKERPELFDAQARLGRICLEEDDEAVFLRWHAGLPGPADESAEIWTVRADWALRQKDLRGAVRGCWEAARRDPVQRRAHFQLGQTLAALGEVSKAEAFQRRNEALQELLLAAKQCNFGPNPSNVLRTLEAAAKCGHPWEVWGWSEAFRKRFPQQAEAVQGFGRPSEGTPRVRQDSQPAAQISLAEFPLPEWMQQTAVPDSRKHAGPADTMISESGIRFTDDAQRSGLLFQYLHGDEIPGPGMRMFQFSGGGTGVVDFDLDGWPDVYLTQGGRWPLQESSRPTDAVFRNLRGQSFQNVTTATSIVEDGYSQGLAIGDVDGDGWSDIFVANVDGNRLFHNNGDGTFEDITVSAGLTAEAWSTSAVCADFNGDALPDLFIVNYLEGHDLLERICSQGDGTPRACTPHEFDAAHDQLLLNLGDGRFRDVSNESGVLASGGKGLGVVAGDFSGSGRLDLFVGNDTTANFFFQNLTDGTTPHPVFEESAVINGLAFDREGRTQACMGIAAGDADGDGSLDLFVTNYFNESNTLYRKQAGVVFMDATAEAQLREPGIRQLGFGTQFLDADLDGHQDLMVTNGHVDDETARDIPLYMPTQFFRNAGEGKFLELTADSIGPWFSGRYLGRAMARIDWNRDGREDLIVGMLDSPTALLTNESTISRSFVSLMLVARNTAREAIGATVTVSSQGGSVSRQLTAGDGYQASNERLLTFAVDADSPVEVTIRWPDGNSQSFPAVLPGRRLVAVEDQTQLAVLPE